MGNVIDSFSGDHSFLSNFYPSSVFAYGETYATVEHAFQATKTRDPKEREWIRSALTPGVAKRRGRKVTMRDDWETFRLEAMEGLLRRKFTHPHLRKMLVDTGDAWIIEGNHWGDRFWGVCGGEGENHLGKLLMKIRAEILSETFDPADSTA